MMKELYSAPKLSILSFPRTDIVTSSVPDVTIIRETIPNSGGEVPPVSFSDIGTHLN